MQITKEILENIAHLARLEFDEGAEKDMLADLNKILDWMEKLNEVNTDEVTPLIHISAERNVLREDEVQPSLSHEKGLLNAPDKDANYFRVPKVIE